jgi:hypothetical protein
VTDASVTEKAASALDTAASATADTASAVSAAVGDAAASTGAAAARAADTAEKKAASATATVEKKAGAVAAAVEKKADAVASKSGEKPGEKPAPPQRSMSEIEAELDATRARLAGRIDDLQSYVAPRNIADRQMAKVKGVFVDEYGGIKPDRVLIAVGVVAALVGVSLLRRRRG